MPMTKLMEQVIAKVSSLPPEEQEYYATIILDELEDEQKWDAAFAASQDQLAKLADEALGILKQERPRRWISPPGGNDLPHY